jgi:hypothetical protein
MHIGFTILVLNQWNEEFRERQIRLKFAEDWYILSIYIPSSLPPVPHPKHIVRHLTAIIYIQTSFYLNFITNIVFPSFFYSFERYPIRINKKFKVCSYKKSLLTIIKAIKDIILAFETVIP